MAKRSKNKVCQNKKCGRPHDGFISRDYCPLCVASNFEGKFEDRLVHQASRVVGGRRRR